MIQHSNNRIHAFLAVLSVLFFTSFNGQAAANEKQDIGAQIFVQTMTENGLSFLSDTSLTKDQKAKKFKHRLNSNFDIPRIGKFAVGRYWRKMTPAQQKEYQETFKEMLVNVYSSRFDEYQGQKITLSDTVSLSEKDTLVKSIISGGSNGAEIPVDWRIRHTNGKYRVIDVMVAGVSMSVTQRSDFSAVIQRGGGDVAVLINHLKE
jgi:phospholipid transport system substrate-binding protein